MYFRVCFQTHAYVILSFLSWHQYSYCQSLIDHSRQSYIFKFASCSALTLLFSCGDISSNAWLTISLLSWCLLIIFLVAGSCTRSLVGLVLEYLKPNYLKTFRLSDECPWQCTRQEGLDLSFGLSTYLFLRLPELSLILE